MEDFFYFNITNNEKLKSDISNILIFLDNINKKINYTKINILEKEGDLIKFLLNKFKKLYLFQFMVNPNEDIQIALNNSLILLFNEINNNLNYNQETDINENYLEILKNKSIYKFLEELEENKDNLTTKRFLDLTLMDIEYIKSLLMSNNEHINTIEYKFNDFNNKFEKIYKGLFYISVSAFFIIKLSTLYPLK